ncbi:hypothetical protein D3C81_990830 [compost metagenome]
MQWPPAAGAQQHEAARIAPALGHVHARGAGHVLGNDVMDAPGHAGDVTRQPLACTAKCFGGAVHADGHRAACEVIGIEVAEHEIGIRHGRIGAAQPVAGRPRLGTGALRPHFQQAQGVLVRNAAATGADLDQVDGGNADWQAAAFGKTFAPSRFEAEGDGRLAILHQAQLGRGAAHVEGQQVWLCIAQAVVGRRDRASRGAGLEQLDRIALGLADMRQAAVGQHHQHASVQTQRLQATFERVEVARCQRLDIGIGDGGGIALELADDGRHIGRQGDVQAGEITLDPVAHQPLVRRRAVGVQQAHGK